MFEENVKLEVYSSRPDSHTNELTRDVLDWGSTYNHPRRCTYSNAYLLLYYKLINLMIVKQVIAYTINVRRCKAHCDITCALHKHYITLHSIYSSFKQGPQNIYLFVFWYFQWLSLPFALVNKAVTNISTTSNTWVGEWPKNYGPWVDFALLLVWKQRYAFLIRLCQSLLCRISILVPYTQTS